MYTMSIRSLVARCVCVYVRVQIEAGGNSLQILFSFYFKLQQYIN